MVLPSMPFRDTPKMNIHVYIRAQAEPLKFYDTDAKTRFNMHTGESGTLEIVQHDIDGIATNIAIFGEGVWVAAYDVNHDPDA